MELSQIIERISLIFGSAVLAFLIAFLLSPWFTRQLTRFRIGKQIRENAMSGEKSKLFSALHAKKSGTPTMGGILIWGTSLIVIILSRIFSALGVIDHSLLNRKETYIPIFTLISFGLLGAIDDYLNVKGIGKTKGLSAKLKLFWLIVLSLLGAWWFYSKLGFSSLAIPIPSIEAIELGIFYIPLFILVIISTANAVNFTDGLDGLASGLLILAFGSFGIFAFTEGMYILSAFCAIISGSLLAFLWFNIPPAKFYMGDTGSLALGATLGVIAMLTDQTLILPIVGFMFVIEALSVIIQLTSKKLFGKKVFRIAPIHHHFEQKGMKEFTIVMKFWIIGGIMAVFGTILGLINISA
ncbi:phospho-N-acetylmuramoyl-pentapeptide-transferase [Candidatus Peregrinibacteria bacterium]|nr:phospho-N-acetylmuramoyl-pentapeptide-transferase [Candidatus Peregrinibacteria bacterium]